MKKRRRIMMEEDITLSTLKRKAIDAESAEEAWSLFVKFAKKIEFDLDKFHERLKKRFGE